MTEPLTPRASPSDSRIVVDCEVCHRTIWAGTPCSHGEIPTKPTGNNEDALVVTLGADVKRGKLKGGRP